MSATGSECNWLPINQYPAKGTALRVEVLMSDGSTHPDAHYACGDGDGMMPSFDGWFIPSGHGFVGIATPTHWRPIPAPMSATPEGGDQVDDFRTALRRYRYAWMTIERRAAANNPLYTLDIEHLNELHQAGRALMDAHTAAIAAHVAARVGEIRTVVLEWDAADRERHWNNRVDRADDIKRRVREAEGALRNLAQTLQTTPEPR